MKGIGFRRRIKTPDRPATGPAVLLHNEEHGTAPARFSVPQAWKSHGTQGQADQDAGRNRAGGHCLIESMTAVRGVSW